jgi:hypothetical protein
MVNTERIIAFKKMLEKDYPFLTPEAVIRITMETKHLVDEAYDNPIQKISRVDMRA